MKITDETISFHSLPRFFLLERYGSKPHTERQIAGKELELFYKVRHDLKYIIIINTDTNEHFTRKLTNISTVRFPETRVWIFSWESKGMLHD